MLCPHILLDHHKSLVIASLIFSLSGSILSSVKPWGGSPVGVRASAARIQQITASKQVIKMLRSVEIGGICFTHVAFKSTANGESAPVGVFPASMT